MKKAFRSSTISMALELDDLSSSKPRNRVYIASRASDILRNTRAAARAVRDLRAAAEQIEAWAKTHLR